VVIGLSGGVDSAASALLLRREYEVVGLHLILYRAEDLQAARKVSQLLNIPLRILNLRGEFREKIMDYFAREYRRGRTPNPCALCNFQMKFRYLEEVRREEGADFIATGHYAKVVEKEGRFYLAPGKDREKSQEYFLALLPEELLSRTLFPLGELTKGEAKRLAGRMAKVRESQDICFVGAGKYHEFLEREYGFSPQKGDIISPSGQKIGEHSGFYKFTVGQRRGIGVASSEGPLYVLRISPGDNSVVVGTRREAHFSNMEVELKVWKAEEEGIFKVKLRYRHPGALAKVKIKAPRAEVRFLSPQFAPAPGQLAVFYDREDLMVGAGFISRAF